MSKRKLIRTCFNNKRSSFSSLCRCDALLTGFEHVASRYAQQQQMAQEEYMRQQAYQQQLYMQQNQQQVSLCFSSANATLTSNGIFSPSFLSQLPTAPTIRLRHLHPHLLSRLHHRFPPAILSLTLLHHLSHQHQHLLLPVSKPNGHNGMTASMPNLLECSRGDEKMVWIPLEILGICVYLC